MALVDGEWIGTKTLSFFLFCDLERNLFGTEWYSGETNNQVYVLIETSGITDLCESTRVNIRTVV